MILSDVLSTIRKLPSLVDMAKNALNSSSPELQALKSTYDVIQKTFPELPIIANGTVGQIILSVISNVRSVMNTLKARSTSLTKAVNEVAAVGLNNESVHQTIKRQSNNPGVIQLEGYFSQVRQEMREEKYSLDDLLITDVSHRLPMISENQRVQAANGGTIDIAPCTTGYNTANGQLHLVGPITPAITDVVAVSPGSAYMSVSSATNITSYWWKATGGILDTAVSFVSTGANAYTVNPTIQVIIPARVPSGTLKIIGKRRGVDSASISNPGAGTDSARVSGMLTTGCTLSVADASGTYWTWGDGEDNEEYAFYRYINKASGTSSTTIITLTLTATAACYFTSYFHFEYYPHNVRLRDLNSYNVDLDASDPVIKGLTMHQIYDVYCADNNIPTFLQLLNARGNSSYNEAVLDPRNWNTTTFTTPFMTFLDSYLFIWKMRRSLILLDVAFLETV